MLASSARANSQATNSQQKLQPAVAVELLDTGYYAVVGACGHRLTVVLPKDAPGWEERIAAGRRHRKRCFHCAR